MNNDCIFCKIGRAEIPHDRFYEDENFLAFLDINPVNEGHTLIIPKKHVVWMQEADDETISEIFQLTKKIMLGMVKALGCNYVQVSVVGKDVAHFHIHLIPRFLNDYFPLHPTKKYKDNEAKEVAQKLISALE